MAASMLSWATESAASLVEKAFGSNVRTCVLVFCIILFACAHGEELAHIFCVHCRSLDRCGSNLAYLPAVYWFNQSYIIAVDNVGLLLRLFPIFDTHSTQKSATECCMLLCTCVYRQAADRATPYTAHVKPCVCVCVCVCVCALRICASLVGHAICVASAF